MRNDYCSSRMLMYNIDEHGLSEVIILLKFDFDWFVLLVLM